MLAIEYHVYIWQVSLSVRYGDTCQIRMWFEETNQYFCHIGEIDERSFSNPHPWALHRCSFWIVICWHRLYIIEKVDVGNSVSFYYFRYLDVGFAPFFKSPASEIGMTFYVGDVQANKKE